MRELYELCVVWPWVVRVLHVVGVAYDVCGVRCAVLRCVALPVLVCLCCVICLCCVLLAPKRVSCVCRVCWALCV